MNKVKKYADKRQEDLQNLYKSIKNDFTHLASEFDAKQTQANAAIKLLNQQNEAFAEKMKSFSKDISSVQNIRAQIDSYAKVLEDLNQMTDQVEENLQRIHKESAIVDSIIKRLDKQDSIVEGIENKIPQISKEFSAHNAEQLKAIGTKLLDQYEEYAKNLSQDIKNSQTAAEDTLVKIKQNIQAVYDQAAERAEKLENTAFEHLSQQAQARSDQYLGELKNQPESLQNELQNQFNIASNKISERFDEISNDMESKSAELENLFNQKINDTTQGYKDAESKLITDTKARLASINDKFN